MAQAGRHEAMDMETVADLLGISDKQVRNLINHKGLPSTGSGRTRTFVWRDVLAWWVDYQVSLGRYTGTDGNGPGENDDETSGEDLKGSEARRARYLADLKKIDLQERLGKLVPMADVVRVTQDVAKGLQTEILAFPSRIAGTAVGIRDQAEMSAFLTRECDGLCTRLSGLRFDQPAEPVPESDSDADAE